MDAYWFTDPNICGLSEAGWFFGTDAVVPAERCKVARNYGLVVDKVRSLVSPAGSKPVWNFVELGHPFGDGGGATTISGPQIRAAVWSGLIHGARGVVYFNHNFGGTCISQHVLRDSCGSQIRPTVTAVNKQIASLAPVLNAPFLDGAAQVAGGGADVAVKTYGGSLYVLAGSTAATSHSVTVKLACSTGSSAEVLDEGRSVPVVGGAFTDTFADGNAVHLYRLGAGCGLA